MGVRGWNILEHFVMAAGGDRSTVSDRRSLVLHVSVFQK